MADVVELDIQRLGARGDGIGITNDTEVFVPYALPGERVSVEVDGTRGRLLGVIKPSAHRRAAPCTHFGVCGGCAVQHVDGESYSAWKRDVITAAFKQRGLEAELEPTNSVGDHDRRRAVFSAVRKDGGVALGFHGARSHDIVDIGTCTVVVPEIVRLLPGLREFAGVLCGTSDELRLTVTHCANGMDIAIEGGSKKNITNAGSEVGRIGAQLAQSHGVARVTYNNELAFFLDHPEMAFGDARVRLPPGAFVQASALAEAHIGELICDALPKKAKRAADIFCGLGAFTFQLAHRVSVIAADNDTRVIAALNDAAKAASGCKPIEAKTRDLFREPLSRQELKGCDLAVFDPPRAGAGAQTAMLAKSKIPVVVAVSCNPATLARDVRTLVDAGYRLCQVTPIDQFRYAAHVEAVAILRR